FALLAIDHGADLEQALRSALDSNLLTQDRPHLIEVVQDVYLEVGQLGHSWHWRREFNRRRANDVYGSRHQAGIGLGHLCAQLRVRKLLRAFRGQAQFDRPLWRRKTDGLHARTARLLVHFQHDVDNAPWFAAPRRQTDDLQTVSGNERFGTQYDTALACK